VWRKLWLPVEAQFRWLKGEAMRRWRTLLTGAGAWLPETVSVDPQVVPLGMRLVIDKLGPRVAADTGGAIRVGGWISGSRQ
jgi:hypothetical protein